MKKWVQRFKAWILEIYRVPWHTLSDAALWDALDRFNEENPGLELKKFWD